MNVAAVESLLVKGGDGNDTLAGQNGIGTLTSLTLDGGNGDDSVRGGDGADTLLGGAGNDLVDGNIGADSAHGGSGNDHLQWDPGDGSDVVEGDGGTDTLDFNGSNIGEQITLSANGPRVSVFRNVASITLDVDGVEAAAIRALGGADDVTVGNLTGTAMRNVAVNLAGFDGNGDGAVDHAVVQGTDGPDRVTLGSEGATAVISGLAAGGAREWRRNAGQRDCGAARRRRHDRLQRRADRRGTRRRRRRPGHGHRHLQRHRRRRPDRHRPRRHLRWCARSPRAPRSWARARSKNSSSRAARATTRSPARTASAL